MFGLVCACAVSMQRSTSLETLSCWLWSCQYLAKRNNVDVAKALVEEKDRSEHAERLSRRQVGRGYPQCYL